MDIEKPVEVLRDGNIVPASHRTIKILDEIFNVAGRVYYPDS